MRLLMKSIMVIFILFVCRFSTASSSESSQAGVVKAVALRHWPPHYITDSKSGKPSGFAIDIMNKAAEISGLKIRFIVYNDWPDALEGVRKKQAVVIPNMGITEDRLKLYDFTTPYETFRICVFIRKSTSDIHDLDHLAGKIIGAVQTNRGLNEMNNRGFHDILAYKSPEELFMALLSGNVDAAVYPESIFVGLAKQSGLDGQIKTVGPPLVEIKRAIAVRKGETKLFSRLDAAVQTLITMNEYTVIFEKWHGKPDPFWNVNRVVVVMACLMGVLASVLLFWRYVSILKLNNTLANAISRLEETQQYLQEAILRQKEAIKAANVGLWDWNLATSEVHYSLEWKRQIGYEDHEIDNDYKEWESRVHPDDLGPTLEKVNQAIALSSQDHHAEFRFRHKNGSYLCCGGC